MRYFLKSMNKSSIFSALFSFIKSVRYKHIVDKKIMNGQLFQYFKKL